MFKQLSDVLLRQKGEGDRPPSLDKMLETADRHLENYETLIEPTPESRPRTPFDGDVPKAEMTMANLSAKQRLRVIPKALPMFFNMQAGARMYDGKPVEPEKEAPPEFLARLDQLTRDLGAKDVGYVEVPRYAIFKGKGLPAKYALIFTVEMEKEPIDTSPSFESQLEVMDGYKRMAIISRKLANFMRRHGFAAFPGTALGGLTDYPHLAELAGLGVIGYHGLLITPGEGARLRINTIYTNISNLPTPQSQGKENEHLWVRDFCAMCRKCIRKCPVDAIYEEPRPRGDGGMQTIDHASCRDFFLRNYGCAVCLAVCPFSQSGYEAVKKRFKGNPDAPQFRIPVDVPVDSIEVRS